MTQPLSLFGDAYTPADPPATDACPACGGPSRGGRTCARCKRAGISAARLDLAAPPTADERAAEAVEKAARIAAQTTAPDPLHAAIAVISADEARAEHRARCGGVLMAPVFGIGRTSCGTCDWSPDDPTPPQR